MLPSEAKLDPATLTLRQRAEDLHERARLGGIFYVFSWLLVAGLGDGWHSYPLTSALFLIALLALMAVRVVIRRRYLRQPALAAASIRWQWAVLLLTAAVWGGASCWALLDPAFAAARTVALIATVSLAMAFAQVFAVNPRLSLIGTMTVYTPMFAVVLFGDHQLGLALVLALNGAYLVAVIGRSHSEYVGKLALDEELRDQRDRFAEQSRIDALTGIANRRHFQARLDAGVAEARDGGESLALLIADLDHFKAVNDRFGHAAGDQVLREVATLLRETFIGDRVLVARLGGEEFAVLVSGDAVESLALLAETFRVRLGRSRIELDNGMRFGITVSLGLARFAPELHAGGDSLYTAADEALYRAKAAGRNRLEAA